MKSTIIAKLLVACVPLVSCIMARAEFVLVPRPNAANTLNGTRSPFLITTDQAPSARHQQVFGAQDFQSPGAPLRITDLSFARYPGTSPIDVSLANVAIHFSTTSRNPDELSSTFAQNVGADDRLVFSGPLHFFENGTGPSGYIGEAYNIRVGLQTPFVYDPSAGNLLLDVFNYQALPPTSGQHFVVVIDGFSDYGSSVMGSADSAVGGRNTVALSIGLTYTPVPEPSTLWLLAAGGATFATLRLRRGKFRKEKNVCYRSTA